MQTRLLTTSDLPAVLAIQAQAYLPALHESADTFAAKLSLFPQGVFGCFDGGELVGYVFSHPWTHATPAPLDAGAMVLPASPDCLYIHDLAILPGHHGKGIARKLVTAVFTLATSLGFARLSLVSVQDSQAFWSRYGFIPAATLSYCDGMMAVLMTCPRPSLPTPIAPSLQTNRHAWDDVAHVAQGRTALPLYGPLAPDETELQLLGDLKGLKVLEIGCGTGHSLLYLHQHGAAELTGLDLSGEQLRTAETLCRNAGFSPLLHCSPMETDPGLPTNHFDLILSIYALGWSVDLPATLGHLYRYLRPGGKLIFSWEHPLHNCLKSTPQGLMVHRSYHLEGPVERRSWNGRPIIMHARKLSTYLNTLTTSGFIIDKVIEGEMREHPEHDIPHRYYNQARASLMPTTLIVKASKPPLASG